jgi:hypothetical protein
MTLQDPAAGGGTTGAGLTVSDNVAVAVRAPGFVESVTVRSTLVVPEVLAAGVPEIVPVALAMASPDGSPDAEKV